MNNRANERLTPSDLKPFVVFKDCKGWESLDIDLMIDRMKAVLSLSLSDINFLLF